MLRDRRIARYGSLRCTMARYAHAMEQPCDYCLKVKPDLTIVACHERNSGPPAVLKACGECMILNGFTAWQPRQ